MLFLCGLTCRIILYNRPCTSQRGIALPLWKPLLNQQHYPARITWRFLIRAGAAAPLSNFALTRKVVLKRRMASLISVRPRSLLPRVCRNASGKLLSHPLRGADRACCCWLAAFSAENHVECPERAKAPEGRKNTARVQAVWRTALPRDNGIHKINRPEGAVDSYL